MTKSKQENIETRLANRLRSIFAAIGQVVNDFYLEAGIYFVGLFNAALVGWSIYTDLMTQGQPPAYAIIIGIIALVAVEGLSVYLVGAAARTNSGLLWFFSVVFAGFFTVAHYQEAQSPGVISHYITYAIPFFVVIGYYAKTIKAGAESNEVSAEAERREAIDRQRQIEDEERERQRQIEDEERRHKMDLERIKVEGQNRVKFIKAEGHQEGQKQGHMSPSMSPQSVPTVSPKVSRQNDLVSLVQSDPALGPTELTNLLNDMGHNVSLRTVKRDIKQLNGSLKKENVL